MKTLAPDRVTVDDALISTDVDKLIKTISARRLLDLEQLRSETGISKKNMEKWLHVLEEEGYIKIEYKLTRTFIHWLGESVNAEPELPVEKLVAPKERAAPQGARMSPTAEEAVRRKYGEIGVKVYELVDGQRTMEEIMQETGLDEARLTELLASLRSDGLIAFTYPQARRTVEGRRKPTGKMLDDLLKEAPQGYDEEKLAEEAENVPEEKVEHAIEKGFGRKEPKIDIMESEVAVLVEKDEPESPLKKKVSEYMLEINKQRKEIDSLKKEKENIYSQKYLDVESKFESKIVSITEKILEKEGKLLSLREKLLELPDKVHEAEKMQRAAEKIGKESRTALESAKKKAEALIESTESAEGDILERISGIKSELDKERKRLNDFDGTVRDIEDSQARLEKMLNETQKHAEELNDKMKDARERLEENADVRVEILDMADQLRVAVERREKQLDELNGQFEEIKKVENWVKEYITDYEQKIDEIENYAASSDEELDKLRAAAENEYIKKYLKEMENVADIYESELKKAASEEKEIERRITETKTRLSGLIDESKQMMHSLYNKNEKMPDFGASLRERKEQTTRVRGILEEKASEKERLSEDLDRARKGRKKKK